MFKHSRTIIGTVAESLALMAASAQAQGKSHEKSAKRDKDKTERVENGDRDRVMVLDNDRERNRDIYRSGAKVPPGLAKKPGGMPPGQYKKRYGTTEGASVLSQILGQRGYTVVRTSPYGESRYVYYRASDGAIRRAIVSPGTERLTFSNVPADLLREVLARLY